MGKFHVIVQFQNLSNIQDFLKADDDAEEEDDDDDEDETFDADGGSDDASDGDEGSGQIIPYHNSL